MISRKNFPQKQIHPTTPKTKKETTLATSNSTAVKKKRIEGQHQNGTTTIKKKTDDNEREISDGKLQKKASFVTKRKIETTEAEQTFERKQKIMPKAQNPDLIQKQSKTEERNKIKPTAIEHQTKNGINPLDTILNEIEAFDTANKKNKKAESEDCEADNAPCSSRQLPSTPMPGSYRSLNRMELARQDQNQCMVQPFLERDDLMQRILAYKMLKGRVESYAIIKLKIDLDNCTVPEYELNPTEFDKKDFPCDALSLYVNDMSMDMKIELNNSEMAEQSGLKRGPMTPPGSPGTNQSSTPEADAKPERNMAYHNGLAMKLTENPLMMISKREIDDASLSAEENSTKEMLRNFCLATGVPMEIIRTFLGHGLHKLDKVKMEDLMTTFLASLKKIATKKDKECSSANAIRSPFPNVVLQKEENKSIASEGLPKILVEDNFEMDAMEISSQSVVSSGSLSFSNGLLPPPPVPPPILDATETVAFIVPPPPPPPPLLDENAPFLFPSSSQHHFPSSLPLQMTPKDSPSNGERTPQSNSTHICENKNTSTELTHDHSPAVVRQFRRFSKRPKNYEGRGNKRGKAIPLRFPKPLKMLSKKANAGGRIGRFRQKIMAATPTINCQRPVSLLSLNLTEPYPEAVSRKSDEIMDNNASTSSSIQQQTNGPKPKMNEKNKKAQTSREVPIVLDLEFIKNTPPPPIPDIIKRRIPNDNRITRMRLTTPSQIRAVSQSPKLPPQSLLHMELPRPPFFPLHRPPPAFRQPRIGIHPLPPTAISTPNASAVLQTVVQAIGGNLAHKTQIFQRHPPPPNADASPYGKFF